LELPSTGEINPNVLANDPAVQGGKYLFLYKPDNLAEVNKGKRRLRRTFELDTKHRKKKNGHYMLLTPIENTRNNRPLSIIGQLLSQVESQQQNTMRHFV
jgi:hypothetical protein